MIMIWSCVLTLCLRFYSLRTLWRGSRGSSPDSRRSGTGVQEENGKIKNILTPDTWGRALSRPSGSTACWRKEEMQRRSYSTRRNRCSLQKKETGRNVLATFRWLRAKQSWESSRIFTTGRRFTELELVVVVVVAPYSWNLLLLMLMTINLILRINMNLLIELQIQHHLLQLWWKFISVIYCCSVRNDRAQLTRAVTESHDEVALIKLSRTETIFPP